MKKFSFTVMTTSSPDINKADSPSPKLEADSNGMPLGEDTPDGPPSQAGEIEDDDTDTKKIVEGFIQKTSGHCLPRIVRAKSLRSRCFWSALFCIAIIIFMYQAIKLIKLYASYELVANVNEGTADDIEFPAVTLCNTNKLKWSEIAKSKYKDILKTDPVHEESFHQELSYKGADCLDGDFQCNRSKLCIKSHQRCDGMFHCLDDLSDELNCDKSYILCDEGKFNCEQPGFYGYCIDKNKQCDGIRHCFDGKDEDNCDECKGGLRCDVSNNAGKCIPNERVCDRYPDCYDKTDEMNCKYDLPCDKNLTVHPYMNSSYYSPRYPFPYENNESCIVDLHASSQEFCIAISFVHMDIENHPQCFDDFLRIQDLNPKNPNTQDLCGYNIPDRWISTSSLVRIFFRTDSQRNSQGFHIITEAVVCPSAKKRWKVGNWSECSTSCGGGLKRRKVWCEADEGKSISEDEQAKNCPGLKPLTTAPCVERNNKACNDEFKGGCGQVFKEPYGILQSRGYPDGYHNGIHCRYSILNTDGCINLTFRGLAMQVSDNCELDYIKIEDMNDPSLSKKYCSYENQLWGSHSGNVSVTFHTDIAINSGGYKFEYNFVQCGVWHFSPWSECSATCGYGMRFRNVHCRSRAAGTVQNDAYCGGGKPSTREECLVSTPCPPPSEPVMAKQQTCGGYVLNDTKVCQEFLNIYKKKNVFSRVPGSPTLNWPDFLSFSTSPDYSDLKNVLKLSRQEISQYGHKAEDIILQCSFDDEICSSSEFSTFQNDVYGNCFTFKSDKNVKMRYSDRVNARTGLKLTLNIEQDEYIHMYGQDAGVVVLIHPPDVVPFPEDSGVKVPPGRKASIAMRKDSYIVPGAPYRDCIDPRDFKFNSIFGNNYAYTSEACHVSKLNMHIQEYCKCSDTILLESAKRCSVNKEDQDFCRQYISYLYYLGKLSNDCKQSCRQVTYDKTLSLSQWPSKKHMKGLIKLLRPISVKVRDTIKDEESVRDNLIFLNVYYNDVNYRNTVHKQAYTIDQLVADLGGLFGLYLGISLITIVEFVEFLHDLYSYWISWNRIQKKKAKKKKIYDSQYYDPVPSKSRSADFGTRV